MKLINGKTSKIIKKVDNTTAQCTYEIINHVLPLLNHRNKKLNGTHAKDLAVKCTPRKVENVAIYGKNITISDKNVTICYKNVTICYKNVTICDMPLRVDEFNIILFP